MKYMEARAVITGGASGLGNAVARHIVAAGGRVTLLDVQEGPGQAAASALGKNASFAKCDVTSEEEVNAAMESARAAMGGINLLVNCAGAAHSSPIDRQDDADLDRLLRLNVRAPFVLSRAVVPAMKARRFGRIVNIASTAALRGFRYCTLYTATKHAVVGYSLSLAGELRRAGKPITVSALCPDAIAGDMTNAVAHDSGSDLIFSATTLLTLDEVADAAVRLVDDPELVRTLPRFRGALAHLIRPFPRVGLPLLQQFANLGRRHKAR